MNKITGKKPAGAISPLNGAVLPAPGPGRPRGAKNKLSRTAKENIEKAFEMLGGIDGLVKWANKSDRNRAIFYNSLYARILPLDISSHLTHVGQISIVIKRIITERPPEND